MGAGEASIVRHVALVLFALCFLSHLRLCHPFAFFISFLYLYKVNERCSIRSWRRLKHEERRRANQQKGLSGSESVRWLNHVVEKVWPLCMEQFASQRFLLPIIPWFLESFKPWTAKKAILQHLYLGRCPPTFTEARVLHESTDGDHLLLELGLSFLAADDMSAVIAVKLRKRLGFGIWAKMHVKGMQVEGKVLVGLKFIQHWPFIGRVRLCFIEPPYIQITVKPIFHHGLEVADLPGIASWMDKTIDAAFERTLVEPNMLVIDVEKFISTETESWFTVDVKCPIAFAKVEIVEAIGMQASDSSGLADAYVTGQLGPYRFQTKIQRKTLTPKWLEEFKVPIASWEACNKLIIEVRDKDHIFDDMLGNCSLRISDLRGGQRHDKWVALKNVKTGRLHLAVTIIEVELDSKNPSDGDEEEPSIVSEVTSTGSSPMVRDNTNFVSFSEDSKKLFADDIELSAHQQIGGDVSISWASSKQYENPNHVCFVSPRSSASSSYNGDTSTSETRDRTDGHPHGKIHRGLHKLGLALHRMEKDDNVQSPETGRIKEKAIDIMKHAGKSAHNLKIALKGKIRDKFREEDTESETTRIDFIQGASQRFVQGRKI